MNTQTFLQHVASTLAQRQASYGDPATSLADIAQRWSITLGVEISSAQVALCMLDLKLARLKQNPAHLDSICDVAGYAACLGEMMTWQDKSKYRE